MFALGQRRRSYINRFPRAKQLFAMDLLAQLRDAVSYYIDRRTQKPYYYKRNLAAGRYFWWYICYPANRILCRASRIYMRFERKLYMNVYVCKWSVLWYALIYIYITQHRLASVRWKIREKGEWTTIQIKMLIHQIYIGIYIFRDDIYIYIISHVGRSKLLCLEHKRHIPINLSRDILLFYVEIFISECLIYIKWSAEIIINNKIHITRVFDAFGKSNFFFILLCISEICYVNHPISAIPTHCISSIVMSCDI